MSSWKYRARQPETFARDEGWKRRDNIRNETERRSEVVDIERKSTDHRRDDRDPVIPVTTRYGQKTEAESSTRERQYAPGSGKWDDRWNQRRDRAAVASHTRQSRGDEPADTRRGPDRSRRSTRSPSPDYKGEYSRKGKERSDRQQDSPRQRTPSPEPVRNRNGDVHLSNHAGRDNQPHSASSVDAGQSYGTRSIPQERRRENFDVDVREGRDARPYSGDQSRGDSRDQYDRRREQYATSSSRGQFTRDERDPRPAAVQDRRNHPKSLTLDDEPAASGSTQSPLKRNAGQEGYEGSRKRQRRSPSPTTPLTASAVVGWERWRREKQVPPISAGRDESSRRSPDRDESVRRPDDREHHANAVRNAYGSRNKYDGSYSGADDRTSYHGKQRVSYTTRDRRSMSRSPSRDRYERQSVDKPGPRRASPSPVYSRSRARRRASSTSHTSSSRSPSPERLHWTAHRSDRDASLGQTRRSPSPYTRRHSQSISERKGRGRDRDDQRIDQGGSHRYARPGSPAIPTRNQLERTARGPAPEPKSASTRYSRQSSPGTPPLPEELSTGQDRNVDDVRVLPPSEMRPRGQRRGRTPTGPRSDVARSEQSPRPNLGRNVPTGPAADRRENNPSTDSASAQGQAIDAGALAGGRGFVSIALPKKTPTQPRRDRLLASHANDEPLPVVTGDQTPNQLELLNIRQQLRADHSRYNQLLQQALPYMKLAITMIQKKDPSLQQDVFGLLQTSFRRDPKDHELHAIGMLHRQLKDIKALEGRERELTRPSGEISQPDMARTNYPREGESRGYVGDESPTKGLRSGGWTSKRAGDRRTQSPRHSRASRRSISPATPRSSSRQRDRTRSRSVDRNRSRYRSPSRSRSQSPDRYRRRSRSATPQREFVHRDRERSAQPDRMDGAQRNGRSPPSRGKRDRTETIPAQASVSQPIPVEPKPLRGKPYEKVVQVGEGTYGKVYKARNREGLGLVALKRIRMEGEKDGFPVTAMREIKLLQGLEHENVIRLHEMMVSHGELKYVGVSTADKT
jgi:hypothetical protein